MASDDNPTYGGQAVLEGVMIRGQRYVNVAVRRPDGSIALHSAPLSPMFTGNLRKIPLVRGAITLVESLTLGMRALIYSANVGLEAEGEEIGKGAMVVTLAFSIVIAIVIFFLVPVFASIALEGLLGSDLASNFVEGLIRLAMLLGYIYLIGKLDQINRVFMYHGAEHMAVHAQERLDTLDVESVRKYPTAHPRCGTAFLLTVAVVAILVFSLLEREPLWWLIASRIVLIPPIAAVSYEAIRFSGFHSTNPIVRVLSAPNLELQALTTRKPDDDQIEIAIAAMKQALAADDGRLPEAEKQP